MKLLRKKGHSKQSTSGLKQEGRKKMKPEARKLQKGVTNKNVFRAVGFTCATAWKKRAFQKNLLAPLFPTANTIAQGQEAYNIRRADAQEAIA